MNNPHLYEESNDCQKKDVLACLEQFSMKMKWRKENARILDIGCGDGGVTSILKKFLPANCKLSGCDISKDMVKFASKRHGDENTSFIVLDIASELPKRIKGNFDYVFSSYALNWVKDQKRAFENIFDLLDADGTCFLIIATYHAIYDVYRTLSRTAEWSTWVYDVEQYISPYHDAKEPEKEIADLLKNIGFVDIDVKCEDIVHRFDRNNKHNIEKLLLAVSPFKIPDNKRNDFLNDYLQVLQNIAVEHKINDDVSNGITLYYRSVAVYARKPLFISQCIK